MDSLKVATLYAGKYKVEISLLQNWILIFYVGLLPIIISCNKSDDLEGILNYLPTANETPGIEKSLIIYTDIEPDFISQEFSDSYNLDINNDGTVDFVLMSNSVDPYIIIESNPNGLNGIAAASGPFDSYILPLNKNTLIANPNDYYSIKGFLILGCNTVSTYCAYDWKNTTDKFLGLRFLSDGQTYYGWAQLQIISTALWIVMDYAFNSIPDNYILAGQK